MARTADPQRRTERREAILQEAYKQFAVAGYDRTTTASICRGAGISSGTFFHYFPTKLAVLVGILTAGIEATTGQLQAIEQETRGVGALLAYAEALEADLADPDFGGFAHAIAGIERLPEVAEELTRESALIAAFLDRHLTSALAAGDIRTDTPPAQLTRWVRWLIDGAAQHATTDPVHPGDLKHALRTLLGES